MYCMYTPPLFSKKTFYEEKVFGKLGDKLNIIIPHFWYIACIPPNFTNTSHGKRFFWKVRQD